MAHKDDFKHPPPYYPSSVKQWAHRVVSYSSQYNNSTWSANMVLGEPKVYPQHGDIHGAWASHDITKNEFIELEFLVAVRPTAINIYETFNPGAVVAIKAADSHGHWHVLWSTAGPVHLTASRIFFPPLKETKTKTSLIRLELDCTAANKWCEIDAVQLVGIQDGAVAAVDDTAFVADLKSLVNKEQFSDVQLVVQGKIVHAHKGLLAARSPYFCQLFQKNPLNAVEITLPNISRDDLIAILTFIYTNRLPNDCSVQCLVSLCEVSSTIELPSIRTASTFRLLDIFTCVNVVPVLKLTQHNEHLDDLSGMCINFMADNLKKMCDVPDFSTLEQSIIIRVVQEAAAKLNLE